MSKLAGFLCALALVVVSPAGAQPATVTLPGGFVYFSAGIDHQPGGIVNPGSCVWSGYDYWDAVGNGTLAKGATVTASECLIEDTLAHPVLVNVSSSAPVSVTLTLGDETLIVPATPTRNFFVYALATYTEAYVDLSALPEVPGSNGGRGEQEQVTLSVVNTAGKPVKMTASLSFPQAYYYES